MEKTLEETLSTLKKLLGKNDFVQITVDSDHIRLDAKVAGDTHFEQTLEPGGQITPALQAIEEYLNRRQS